MDGFDFSPENCVRHYCPDCKEVRDVALADSVNWGNVIGMCTDCESEFDYTPIDHKGLLREARRGFC